MWIGGDTPLELQRNATLSFSGQVIDAIGNEPVSLIGYSIEADVAMVAGGAVIASGEAEIDDPAGGGFTVTFTGADFSAVAGALEPVRLAYEIRLISGVNIHPVMRGPLFLLPGVG